MNLVRNETQRNSAALKSAGQSPVSLLPLYEEKRPLCLARCDKSIALHAVREDVPRTGTHLTLTRFRYPPQSKRFVTSA